MLVTEVCPHCGTENDYEYVEGTTPVVTCPECSEEIALCSLCDMDIADCENCKY